MVEPRTFVLRPFPRRLMRSLAGFAAAGTVMALAVWADGTGRPWLPLLLVLAAWGVSGAFAWQIYRQGFDPVSALEVSEDGLTALYREGGKAFVPWRGMRRLIAVEAFRTRAFAVVGESGTIRWFGELADPEAFMALVAEATGLRWEFEARLPDEALT